MRLKTRAVIGWAVIVATVAAVALLLPTTVATTTLAGVALLGVSVGALLVWGAAPQHRSTGTAMRTARATTPARAGKPGTSGTARDRAAA